MKSLLIGLVQAAVLVVPGLLQAQIVVVGERAKSVQPTLPPTATVSTRIPSAYKIRSVDVHARVDDQVAKIQISQVFQNTSSSTLEAQLMFPIPKGAAISGLTLLVDGKELTGKLLKKEEARRIYEEIVRRRRDPALLEYMGQGLYRTSVFPVPPNAERKVEIRYSQLLTKANGLVDLLIPLGASKHAGRPIETLDVSVHVTASEAIKTLYSPTHKVEIERPDETHALAKLSLKNVTSPNDLRLFYGTNNGLVGANLISYKPSKDEDGYFVLLANPAIDATQVEDLSKNVVFILDRSGSMSGQKIEQARGALKFLVGQLKPGDTFNIVAYDSTVETFRPELERVKDETIQAALGFADSLVSGGSTNIDAALQTALHMLNDSARPSYVLFLTDGLPTAGEQNEMKIAANAKQANTVNARLFCFGVGYDVNSRLLDRLSRDQGGRSVYVRPNEDIEAHVSNLYKKIGSPLLTDLKVEFEFDQPQPAGAASPISRTYPKKLTDLFQGEQLVWVGRYKQAGPVKVLLSGSSAGGHKQFSFPAKLIENSTDETHGFVEHLWATRRIGEIIDELDLTGHNQELVDELVQLSIRHGILTPYTSFLAEEDVELADADNVRRAGREAREELSKVSGDAAFGQRRFKGQLQRAEQAAPAAAGGGAPGDDNDGLREIATVRRIGQKTFFRKGDRWMDSAVTKTQEKAAVRVVQFSDAYFKLAANADGRLAKYLNFSEPVVLNLGKKTYQIDPPADR